MASNPALGPLPALLKRSRSAAKIVSAAFDLRDVFVFGGLAMVGYGLSEVYAPSAWLVVGAALFWLGVRKV